MNLEHFDEENSRQEGIDFKKLTYILVKQWHLFLLFGILGLAGAYLYTKSVNQNYQVSTSILVTENLNQIDIKDLFKATQNKSDNNIYNQLEILQSYYPINKALINLNWRTSWYKKELLVWRSIYKEEPYDVQEAQDFANPKGIAICITPDSAESYTVSVDGEVKNNNVITKIKFESTGEFGSPFKNGHFNFTLVKKATNAEAPDEKYKFVFNDLNDATLAYQKSLEVTLKNKKGEIIQCTIKGDEPAKYGEFLNELINVYIESKLSLQNEVNQRSLDFINSQLSGISDSMNTAGTKYTEFRSRNEIIDLKSETTIVMDKLKEAESERAKNQVQLNYFQNLRSYLSKAADYKQLVSPSVVGIEDASLNAMVLKLGELYSRRQYMSFSVRDNNPQLINIDKELAQTRNLLNENLRNLIDNATNTINNLKIREAAIGSQMNKLPKKEQQMVNIQRQVDMTSGIYTFLLQKRAEMKIALASSVPDIQIIDKARPETALPIGLSGKIILIIGLLAGLALPLGLILLYNSLDTHIRTQEDIEDNSSIPIPGNIIHDQSNAAITVHENPKSIIAESFRALRTNLQFMLTEPNGKIITIQSTNPNEGKTFIAVNLASILAMNNQKVLLIGADLRKPKLHKIFEMSNDHGLSTCLIGHDTIDEVIFSTSVPNLFLLPAGPIPPNPSEILGKPEMKMLLDKVRHAFDYVIIDNAPTLLVTDGIIVSQLSDLNIFILRYGFSHKQQLELINHYADKQMVSHLAIVVNDIQSNAFGYAYSRYSRYETYSKNSYKKNYYATEEQPAKIRKNKKSAYKDKIEK
ncbi:MAG: polysaccharide biosynthesis tyrosine autokinase [Mariniphaga sp.]|nr:polysaccharide biosynthesis tyrosine autokinase [Mariniphaga sp.]